MDKMKWAVSAIFHLMRGDMIETRNLLTVIDAPNGDFAESEVRQRIRREYPDARNIAVMRLLVA